MRITLMGDLADEMFELIWNDGELRGTPRLVDRFTPAAEAAGSDVLAFIAAVERGLPVRPQLIVWPDYDRSAVADSQDGLVVDPDGTIRADRR